jgi:amino acid permease
VLDWLLRDRTTGRIVVVQVPNLPLALFLVALVVRVVAHPHGTAGRVVGAVGTAALLYWAGEEVLQGVNPFRRILGGTVLVVVLAGIVARVA